LQDLLLLDCLKNISKTFIDNRKMVVDVNQVIDELYVRI